MRLKPVGSNVSDLCVLQIINMNRNSYRSQYSKLSVTSTYIAYICLSFFGFHIVNDMQDFLVLDTKFYPSLTRPVPIISSFKSYFSSNSFFIVIPNEFPSNPSESQS